MRSPNRIVTRSILQTGSADDMAAHRPDTHKNPVHPMTAPAKSVHRSPTFPMEGNTADVATAASTVLKALRNKQESEHALLFRWACCTHFVEDMTSALCACRTSTKYADAGLRQRSTYMRAYFVSKAP